MAHKLTINLNTKKTKLISFGFRNRLHLSGQIKIREKDTCAETCPCQPLEQVDELKYLGIMIDSKLRWQAHTDMIANKLRKVNYKIRYLAEHFDKILLKTVYHALYESVLRYGIVCWGGASLCHIKQLKLLQKRVVRVLSGIEGWGSTKQAFLDLGLLKLDMIWQNLL